MLVTIINAISLLKIWGDSSYCMVLAHDSSTVPLQAEFCVLLSKDSFLALQMFFFPRKPRNGILRIVLLFPTLPTHWDKNTIRRVPNSSLILPHLAGAPEANTGVWKCPHSLFRWISLPRQSWQQRCLHLKNAHVHSSLPVLGHRLMTLLLIFHDPSASHFS